jgi:ribosomal protein S18 acetylase RimI-like enzyme
MAMSSTVTTREFRIADYDAAVQLWSGVEGVEVAEGDAEEDVVGYISRNPGLSRVAEEGRKIIGAVLCGHDGRRGIIYHLAVDPGYRGQALGRRLVQECLEGLRNAGIKRALILVAADNSRGRSFWRGCGWEEIPGAVAMGIDL